MDTYSHGYDYGGYTSGFASDVLSILFMILGVVLVIFSVILIISIIGQWKMFKKAGKAGWEAIIPIYNVYTLCLITGVNPFWIAIVAGLSFISFFISMFSFISSIAMIYFGVLIAVSTARSFGKDDGYALGLYFLGPFFQLALGVGKSEYLGPKPMEDIIFKSFVSNSTTSNTASNSTVGEAEVKSETASSFAPGEAHYCANCGTKIVINTKYCPNCGKEL